MDLKGKKVMVTGADGFIGSHLVEELIGEGAKVRAFCIYNSNGNWGWLDTSEALVKESLDVVLGDIRDARFVEQACRDIEIVFHLAALIAIPYSYIAPESFIDTNVRGTLNVLEGVKRAGCARLVHASTSEVYGTPDSVPIVETHQLKAQSPYAASKIAADKLCESYACSFATPAVIVRPFNTYGPRQSSRAVLPTILMQLLAGAKTVRLGNCWPKRDFTFVQDTVRGFMLAGSSDLQPGEVVQLGTGTAVSIADLFDKACALLGVEARAETDSVRQRPDDSEVAILLSNPARAKQRLGWTPLVGLDEGLRLTAAWLERHLADRLVEYYYV